jgi:hypothetical protein
MDSMHLLCIAHGGVGCLGCKYLHHGCHCARVEGLRMGLAVGDKAPLLAWTGRVRLVLFAVFVLVIRALEEAP